MVNSANFPRQRQVYLSKALKQSGDTKKRPVVVVSIDIRNQYSSTVLVVPFSSNTSDAANPSRVKIDRGEGGLNVDSVAMCDVMTTIEKRYLESDPYGEITLESFARIQRAIQIAIGIF
ncbi:type II toxin-antitoxin system PemK/MazF family toxin [Myxosarcina sp. GI1]|uniref:type II toxin-antitoxin system PemK/MazF family toxin n=1 Tax=Myxosarcina sp. GI1 TaxID=1541065 RepID=UPI00056D634A|nr:type II toxin-antitoxin system PemK/MazF family toxin [Myxosarcina sp. GI1]